MYCGNLTATMLAIMCTAFCRSLLAQGTEWLLASHGPVDYDAEVAPLLPRLAEFDAVLFKFEPVAALYCCCC